MFRRLTKIALLFVAGGFATTRVSQAQEFPGISAGDLIAWNLAHDQQWLTSCYRLSGKYGPMRGEYVTPTEPAAPPVKWHLNVLECAVDLPYWHWRQAVPRELRAVVEQGKSGLVSYYRPATPAAPTTPQPTPNPYGENYYQYEGGACFYVPHANYWYPQPSGWYWEHYLPTYHQLPGYRWNYDNSPNPGYEGNYYDHQYSR